MTTYVLSQVLLQGVASYKVYTYLSGGLVAANTWSDSGTTLNANPVVLDANGQAKIYIQSGVSYRFIYKTAADVTITDIDPIAVADPGAGGSGGTTVTDLTVTNNLTVEGDTTLEGDLDVTGDVTIGGSLTIIGDTISNGVKLSAQAPGARNGTIDAVAAANAITITYETQASATPSATDPVSVTRRHQTISTGSTHTVNLTSATSLVIPSGATLGCASSEAVRIHIGLIRNAGSSLELACWTASVNSSTTILTYDPAELVTSTAIGTGSDSTQTVYSTTARTSQPLVYLGYIEATSGATAGQWSSVDKIANWEPGMPLPGDKVQEKVTITGAFSSGTTQVPADNTIPQNTEGDQYMTLAITPKSSLNKLTIFAKGQFAASADFTSIYASLFQDTTADALATANATSSGTYGDAWSLIMHYMKAGTTSATTFKIRAGPNTADTCAFNGAAGAAFGGVYNSYMMITEIHA